MQYKNCAIKYVSTGCAIYCGSQYLLTVATEEDARDYIDGLGDSYESPSKPDFRKLFRQYCEKLPGKQFPDDAVIATYNKAALNRFISSFKKKYRVIIETNTICRFDGNLHCVVDIREGFE